MLSRVEVRNRRGALLSLPLEDPSDGFVVADIQGLAPVKANIVTSSASGVDGSQYENSSRTDRNIVIKLGLKPDYILTSVRDLRNWLYDFFMPKSEITLWFYDSSGLAVNILGRVETFDTPLFTDEPTADISVICFDPDFVAPTPITVSGTSTTSTTSETGRMTVFYDGTVETGVDFVINVDRPINEFTVYHRTSDSEIDKTFDFAAPLIAGDVLTIRSVSGNKGVTLLRSNTESSLLRGYSPQSGWLELERGENYIRFYVDGAYEDGAGVPFSVTYTPRYGGL